MSFVNLVEWLVVSSVRWLVASLVVNSPRFDDQMEVKLQELLNHPAIQAGLAPFLVALITAELFQRIKLSGLAVIAGFAVTVYLASDFTIEPLTAARKIVLLGLLSALLALLLTLLQSRWFSWLLPVLGGAVAIWTVQRVLQQQAPQVVDRKSTRLNSSYLVISYA